MLCFLLLLAPISVLANHVLLNDNINHANYGNNTCLTTGEYHDTADYFPAKVYNNTALHYNPSYFKSFKIFNNTNADPWGVDGPRIDMYVMYQCGAPRPPVCDRPVKINAVDTVKRRTVCIQVPAYSIGISDTVGISFLEILGLINRIRYTDSLQYVTSACVQKWAKLQLDKYNHNISVSDDPIIAAQQKASVDIYFQSGGSYGNNSIFTSESSDFGALNRPDWLGFFAAFFNLEHKYHEYMTGVQSRWYEVSNITQNLSPKPLVAMVNYNDWNPSKITWEVLQSHYMSDIITAAGAIPLGRQSFNNSEDFKIYVKDVKVIIDQDTREGPEQFLIKYGFDQSDDFAFLRDRAVYAVDKRMGPGGTDWFESQLAKPDIVLRDMVTMVRPGILHRERVYLRNIYNETITEVTANDCHEDLEEHTNPVTTTIVSTPESTSSAHIIGGYLGHIVIVAVTILISVFNF